MLYSQLRGCVLLLVLLPAPALSTSAGDEGSCADAVSLCTLPCPNDSATRPWGDKCCPPGMDLVTPPTTSSKYHVTFSTPSYEPCSVVTVSVDVLDKDFKVRPRCIVHGIKRSSQLFFLMALILPYFVVVVVLVYPSFSIVPGFTALCSARWLGRRK